VGPAESAGLTSNAGAPSAEWPFQLQYVVRTTTLRRLEMAMITRSVRLASAAAPVWAVVGDFAAIAEWHPDVTAPHLRGPVDPPVAGTERVFAEGGPDEIVERLVARDATHRRLEYAMPDPPFPITGHRAALTVFEHGDDESEVVWTACFDATRQTQAQLEDALGDGVFSVGLDALADRFGRA
jgi:hypothetical protein